MEQSVVASPLSRLDIRHFSLSVRRESGLENELMFPIVPFLEWILPEAIEDFTLVIEDEWAMGDIHGLAKPQENAIYIREDVCKRAINGEGRDRFTLAHELGHFLLHTPQRVGHARLPNGTKIEAFRNPEWQANAFAGELLVPANLVSEMSPIEIVYKCGVSMQAAEIQMKALHGRRS